MLLVHGHLCMERRQDFRLRLRNENFGFVTCREYSVEWPACGLNPSMNLFLVFLNWSVVRRFLC